MKSTCLLSKHNSSKDGFLVLAVAVLYIVLIVTFSSPHHISLLKQDVHTLKENVETLKENVETLKEDVEMLKEDSNRSIKWFW